MPTPAPELPDDAVESSRRQPFAWAGFQAWLRVHVRTDGESKDRLQAGGLPTQRFAQGRECGDNEDARQGCESDV